MNGKDMFRGMEYVGNDLIEEAEDYQFRQTHRRIRSPLLVAAMIALMLFLMGCAVAFVLRMSNLKIGAGTAEQDYSLVDGVYVKDPHTVTTTTLTLAGLEGSDTYKATLTERNTRRIMPTGRATATQCTPGRRSWLSNTA